MSYDLDFWKYKKGTHLNHQKVYESLCDGSYVEGLETLPVREIIDDFKKEFKDWTIQENDFEKEGSGSFQIYTTEQFVRVDCYGVSGDNMNRMIDIMLKYDCPLYDPQINTRFDGE